MAETEGTGTEQDRAGRAPAGPTDPVPAAQRSFLPTRRAGTMPDVSRYAEAPAQDPTPPPTDGPGAGETSAEQLTPPTAALPLTAASAPGRADDHHSGASAVTTSATATEVDATKAFPTPPGPTKSDATGSDATGIGPMAAGVTERRTRKESGSPATASVPGSAVEAGAAEDAPSGSSSTDGPKHSSADGGPESRRGPDNEPDSDTGALLLRPSEEEVQRRALEREHAVTAKPALARFLQVLVAVIFPVVVLAGAVRAVASSLFLWIEYHRPGFPADEFGFSTEDRMTYGSYAVDYVLNLAPARYLGGLVNPGGQQLFLDSEVSHMADVKAVLGLSFAAAFLLLVIAIASCIYLARRYKGGIRRALFAGAALTLALIVALAVTAVLAWEFFFTAVHGLFFADGTWTFRVDDTLIRLFPEQFWTDSAATVGFLVLATTLLTLVLTWPTRRRREASRDAQNALQARHRAALSGS